MIRIALSAIAFLGAFTTLTLSAGSAHAQKRVALVVGNSKYTNTAMLPNPSRDAAAVADMFKKAGFDVVTARTDLGNLDFKRAIRDFTAAARGAEIAVFFYAGHGVEINRENYLVPVDAKLASDIDAEDEAVPLDRVVRALEPARRLRLVILDACRDNPFLQKMERTVAMRAITNGLGKVEPTTSDTLIAYAAKAGSTAEDGDGQHSPFTSALLKNLTQPGLDVRLAFGKIRDEVMQSTGNQQEPFVYGSLGGSTVSLVPAPAQAKAPSVANDPNAAMRADYEMAERVGTVEAWDSFLSVYTDGLYANLARAQRSKLSAAQGRTTLAMATPAEQQPTQVARAVPHVEAPVPADQQRPSREEQREWDKIKNGSDRAAIRKFIDRFPASPLALTAQHRLNILERAAQEREDKARAEREAAQKADEERRAKAAEAERQRVEREAARQRELDEQRQRAAEAAERQKAEREAARQRAAEEQAAKAREAQELARQRAEEQAAKPGQAEGQGTPNAQPAPTQSAQPAQPSPAEQQAAREKAAREAAEKQAAERRREQARAEKAEREAAEREAAQRRQQRTREAEREERDAARRRAERAASERAERAAAERAERAERAAAERRNNAEARRRSQEREVVQRAPARSAPPRARAEASAAPRPSRPFSGGGGGGGFGGGGGGGASMTGVGF